MDFVPRGKAYALPIACTCGGSNFRRVQKVARGHHPMIDRKTVDLIRCEKCGAYHDYQPDPADVAEQARRVT